ncbi:MAG: autotransporter-associated beta strand repeat-containing protein, partial [Chthoniobacterales bacterium]
INDGTAIGAIIANRTLANNFVINGNFTNGLVGASTNTGSLTINGTVDLGGGTRTISLENSLTLGGVVSNGGLVINNINATNRTLTLGASNSFAGGITLNSGYLSLTHANGAGTGSITQTDGTSQVRINVAGTIANDMSLYNVAFLQGGALSGALPMNNTTFDVTNNVVGTIASDLGGGSSLTKTGSGTVILAGNNSYSGGTLVSAGALQGSTTSLQGPITNNAAITFDQSTGGTYAGVVSGSGSLTKLGSGTVILTGSNAYTGSTYINAGALAFGETQDNTFTNRIYLGATSGSSNATLIISNGVTLANDITVQAGSTGQNTLKMMRELAEQNGSETLAGDVALEREVIVDADAGGLVLDGLVSGVGSMVKIGAGSVTLSASNSYAGGTTLSNGVLRLTSANAAGSGAITQSSGASTLQIDTTGTVANAMSIFNIRTLQTVTLSGNKTLNNATYTVDSGTTTTESGVLSGSGGITKEGAGSLVVTASNSFTGATVVNAGTLNLNSSTGSALGASTNVTVGATLLISQSNQINDSAAVTLSGGTIRLGGDVSEAFSSLNLTTGSFLDFGSGTASSLSFGTYEENATPSALLTLDNFIPGNSFTFSNALFAADGSNIGSYFTFGTGFVDRSITDNGGNSFTITAIPEPSTYLAAAGLLSLMLWPSRRRIIRDTKKILGFRAPMRDRLAAKRA